MPDPSPLTIGVAFGGVSPEHEVSVITALQAVEHLDRRRYRPVPVYISKSGHWFTGEGLFEIERYKDLDALVPEAVPVHLAHTAGRGALLVESSPSRFRRPRQWNLDVMLVGLHGGPGENGSFQGLCESFGLPYTGSGVLGSSLGMDKVLSKIACRQQEIPVVDWVDFRESDWVEHEEEWLDRIETEIGYPCVIKPARLGSSIGISMARNRKALDRGIEEALRYDEKILVERALQRLREINCSILGNTHEAEAGVLEEPLKSGGEDLLSFSEKYQRGEGKTGKKHRPPGGDDAMAAGMASLDRIIPASIDESLADEIRELGVRVFQLLECSGVARIDFMIDEETNQMYFNEINTIPGSLSYYLWEPAGVPFTELLDRLIGLALDRHRSENGRIRSYDTNLLSEFGARGIKGAKAEG